MNNKIQIILYVPKLNEKYDILIPINKELNEVVIQLEEAIKKMSNGIFNETNCRLYSANNLYEYNYEQTAKENNIQNGSYVILY